MMAGPRLSGKEGTAEPAPFGTVAILGDREVPIAAVAAAFGSCFIGLGCGEMDAALQFLFGFKAGLFKLGKYVAMGAYLGWTAGGGICHYNDSTFSCDAALRSFLTNSPS